MGGHTGKYATLDSKEITRHVGHVGHVERERPAPGKHNPSWGKVACHGGFSQRFVLPPSAESMLEISRVGKWWLNASNQSVRGKFKTHFAYQIPGCLGCFCETWFLCHPTRAGTRPRSQGREHRSLASNQRNWPNKRAPSCAWQALRKPTPPKERKTLNPKPYKLKP